MIEALKLMLESKMAGENDHVLESGDEDDGSKHVFRTILP
jgi:hypothetical protein